MHHLVLVAVLFTVLETLAAAESFVESPISREGVTAALTLEKNEQKVDEPLHVTITIACKSHDILYNPFFNGLLPEPGRIVVRNGRGKVVNTLLEWHEGSLARVDEGAFFDMDEKSFIGVTKTIFPSRCWRKGHLPPGDYTLQLEFDEIFLSEFQNWHKIWNSRTNQTKAIITSERLPYRIVE